MNDKLTQRPELWDTKETLWMKDENTFNDHIRALQAYIEKLEVQVMGHAIDAQMLADKLEAKQAPVDKEGWLTKEEIFWLWQNCELEANSAAPVTNKFATLCRMALYALNGPPAVDWMPIESAPKDGTRILAHGWNHGKKISGRHVVVTAWLHGWRTEDNEDEWSDTELTFLTHWLPLPPAPTDHKEPQR